MTVARSVADVLDDHVVFEVESIDRMYLNGWQPRLAYGGGVQGFFVGHRGHHYASTALMDPMTKAFVTDIHGFIAARGLELVHCIFISWMPTSARSSSSSAPTSLIPPSCALTTMSGLNARQQGGDRF
jgi:hypothetical protein